jgi:hypothetical protein
MCPGPACLPLKLSFVQACGQHVFIGGTPYPHWSSTKLTTTVDVCSEENCYFDLSMQHCNWNVACLCAGSETESVRLCFDRGALLGTGTGLLFSM